MIVGEKTLYLCDRCLQEGKGYTLRLPRGWTKKDDKDFCSHCFVWVREEEYKKASGTE